MKAVPRVLPVCAFILALASCAFSRNPDPAPEGGSRTSNWVNGYYVCYHADRLPPDEIYWEGMTHISVGAILVIDDSESDAIPPVIDKTFYQGGEAQGVALASSVSSLAIRNGVTPILMLGGENGGATIRNATSPGSLDGFADSLIAATRDLGFKGIDLDWEDDIDWTRFRALAAALRAKAPDLVLTMPVGNLNPNIADNDVAEVVALAPSMDQINVMSYFGCGTVWYGTGWYSGFGSALREDSGPNSNPVSIEYTLAAYAAAGIDKKKLGMGMGFYGFSYADGITGPRQTGNNGSSGVVQDVFRGGDNSYSLSKLFTGEAYLYAQANGCVKWDEAAECSYLSLPADHPDAFGCRYVSFEDERSILAKGRFCRENGYGGTIIWTIDQGYAGDHADPHFLMKAVRKAFIEPDFPLTPSITVYPEFKYAKPERTAQFRALVTGADSLAVSWTAGGGTIDDSGLFTAGTAQGSFEIQARSNGLSSSASVTVSSAAWAPTLTLYYRDFFWKELRTSDSSVSVVKMMYGGTTYFWNRQQYNDRIFTNMDEVPEGGSITFVAETDDGRSAVCPAFLYHCNHDDPDWEELDVLLTDE